MNTAHGLLCVERVGYRYETSNWELSGLSFEARPGEILAIIGPNGSGKSTLLKIAAGILSPRDGRVRLAGRDMSSLPRRDVARSLGYLPQQTQPAFDYTVEETVSMGRFPHLSGLGFLRATDLRVVESAMRTTETLEYRARPLSRLSGGERQRVFLASVLAQGPRVLLLDEPTSALDIHHQARFFRLLRELAVSAQTAPAAGEECRVQSAERRMQNGTTTTTTTGHASAVKSEIRNQKSEIGNPPSSVPPPALSEQRESNGCLRDEAGGGMAVVVVTHDLNIASLYCDRLLLLSKGRAAREGTAEEVLRREILAEVYGEEVHVERDSRTGRPIVLPAAPGRKP